MDIELHCSQPVAVDSPEAEVYCLTTLQENYARGAEAIADQVAEATGSQDAACEAVRAYFLRCNLN